MKKIFTAVISLLTIIILASCSDAPKHENISSAVKNTSQTVPASQTPGNVKNTTASKAPVETQKPSIDNSDDYKNYIKTIKENEQKEFYDEDGFEKDESDTIKPAFWDKELNKIYQLLIAKLSDTETEKLRQAERLWIKERDAAAAEEIFESHLYYYVLYNKTKERTLELIQIYYDGKYNEYYKEEYTIKHENDGSTYTLFTVWNSDNATITLVIYDSNLNQTQTLTIDNGFYSDPFGDAIGFLDANSDGFSDISFYTGGTMNVTYDLYTWQESLKGFEKTTLKGFDMGTGFDMLAYFEIHDDCILNWVKNDAYSGVVQTFKWEGNTLVLVSEEPYELG